MMAMAAPMMAMAMKMRDSSGRSAAVMPKAAMDGYSITCDTMGSEKVFGGGIIGEKMGRG